MIEPVAASSRKLASSVRLVMRPLMLMPTAISTMPSTISHTRQITMREKVTRNMLLAGWSRV